MYDYHKVVVTSSTHARHRDTLERSQVCFGMFQDTKGTLRVLVLYLQVPRQGKVPYLTLLDSLSAVCSILYVSAAVTLQYLSNKVNFALSLPLYHLASVIVRT